MSARPAPPLDARWVPALLACLGVGGILPGRSAADTSAIAGACLAVGAVGAVVALVLGRRRADPSTDPRREEDGRGDGSRRTGALTAVMLAAAATALMAQHASLARAGEERSGWADAVSDSRPLRVELAGITPPVPADSRFGPRWSARAQVTRFGHPLRAPQEREPVLLSGEGDPPALGAAACAVVEPRRGGADVFLAVRTPPTPGPCPAEAGRPEGGPGETLPGREVLRAAFRDAAAPTVGAAPQLVPGLVLGDRTVQTPELEDAMKAAGLSHLSAVSGANCALLAGAVTILLRTLRVHRHAVVAAVLAVLAVFVVIVGPEPSVLRAAVMGGLGALAVFFGRGRQAFSLLAAGATALLIVVPSLATEVAFHLSLAATAGIVLVAGPADAWLHAHLSRVLPDVAARWLSSSLAVTTAAHLACQPSLLLMTGSLSTYAVPANLAAAPAVAPVTVVGTLAAALVVRAPQVASALVWLVQWPAAFIGQTALVSAGLPGALRPWPAGALGLGLGALLTVATLAGFAAVLVLERRAEPRVRRVGRTAPAARRRTSALAVLTAALVASAAGAVAAVMVPRPAGPVPRDWAVAFCDVGQGDMSVFRTGEGAALVVDVGPDPESARRCLEDLRIQRVDAVLLTHLHADHTGGLAGLSGHLAPAGVHYATRDAAPPAVPSGAGGHAGEAGGTSPPAGGTRLRTGQTGARGDVTWTVLLADAAAAEENDASAQLLVTVRRADTPVTTLVTGDLEDRAGAAWVRGLRSDAGPPPRADVLKVAHHGARNGGTDVPRAVRARLQVISVGADNTYGHPHAPTVAALEALGPVARTDRHGTIALTSEPDGALVPHTVRPPTMAAATP